jgi:hypothetical protein
MVTRNDDGWPTKAELEAWASLSIEWLQALEEQIYGRPLSFRRAQAMRVGPQRKVSQARRSARRPDGEPAEVTHLCVSNQTWKDGEMAWSDPVSDELASQRAGGRRRYHALRRDRATVRRGRLAQLLRVYGWTRGIQARIARELGCSQATISRDAKWLRDQMRPM